jgi:Flp pilus assembly protein CpaB
VRRSKEIVVLLLVFVGLAGVALWTVVTRKAQQRAAPAAEKRELGPVASPPKP